MFCQITIIRDTSDQLNRQVWRFVVIDNMIILDTYAVENRSTRRHKHQPKGATYSRLNTRDHKLSEEDTPLPQHVRKEALTQYMSTLRVGFWKQDFKK